LDIGSRRLLKLSAAVLIYSDGAGAFATQHEVKLPPEGGAPYLGEAQPLTTAFLRHLARGLGSTLAPEILPANVLARTPEMIAWWSSAQQRTMFFADHSDADRMLNGKRFPQPALVFKVDAGRLSVRALAENRRPQAETRLRTAPYWNTDHRGFVCTGSMRVPEETNAESIVAWERAYFQSEFTHAYGAARLTSFPGGFMALWKSLVGSERDFPVEFLTDARQTLRQFIEESEPS